MKKMNFWIFLFFIIFIFIQLVIPRNYNFNADEGTHALIGLFYRDILMNIGNFNSFNDITRFAVNYIVKYPKISAHYPPLYHLLLASVFLIAESLFFIRIFNVLLTVLTSFVIYKLTFKLSPKKNIALMSAIFFLSFSIIFHYADKIMIDNLQILTFSSVLLFYLKLRNEKKIPLLNIVILSCLLALSFLTKFFSVFLPIIIFVDIFFHNRKLIRYFLLSVVLSLIIISPYLFFYIKYGFYKLAINVAQSPQIVQIIQKQTKLSYFNVFSIFGIFVGPLVAIATIWFIWKNLKTPLIISWFFIPFFVFLFLFKDIEFRFLYILMPIYSLACSDFIFKKIEGPRSKRRRKLLFGFVLALIALQFINNISARFQDTYYPINNVMKTIAGDGNILMVSDGPIYSSIYILYARLNNIKGNFIRPCVLGQNNLTKEFLNEWGVQYIIDQNNIIDETSKNSLNIDTIKEIEVKDVSIRVFEVKGVVNKADCNFICVLDGKVCKDQSLSDVTSLID